MTRTESLHHHSKEAKIDAHDINEQARVLSHRHYATVIDQRPELIEQARSLLSHCIPKDGGTPGQRLWELILQRQWQDVRERMLAYGAEGRLLRSNSPFSRLIGITDSEERRPLWQ